MPLRVRVNNRLMQTEFDSSIQSLLFLFETWKLILIKISYGHGVIDYFSVIIIRIYMGFGFFWNAFRNWITERFRFGVIRKIGI